ncbi:MAG: hypothetical protein GWO23_16805 [Gammaproteobacteria bacterium]|nr:hypothetical protein [Gammaproteobacteria bacterium]
MIGKVVHQWLERIVLDGLGAWTVDVVADHRAQFIRQLGAEGIPASRLSECASSVEECLVNTLSSDRGRWLLSTHKEVDTELELNGVIEGQLVRAAIDLTFVDDDDCRWVVDYKTSSPSGGENVEMFLAKENERYQQQLQTYSRLMSGLKPKQRVRAALYFPMIDAWTECTALK